MADNDQTVDEKRDDNRDDETVVVGPVQRNYAVLGNDLTGYLGVADEYMTYANPIDKPYMTETEAYLYTNMSDEDIEASRNRTLPEGVELAENEKPAIAEDTFDEGAFVGYGSQNFVTLDPVAGPQHPQIMRDADEDDEDDEDDEKKKDDEVQKSESENQASAPAQSAATQQTGQQPAQRPTLGNS